MKTLNELTEAIRLKKIEIKNFEIDPDKYIDQYEEMLNETNKVLIAGIEYSASNTLKEIDPTAYRCGLNDYIDSLDIEDDEDYKKLCEELEELEWKIIIKE